MNQNCNGGCRPGAVGEEYDIKPEPDGSLSIVDRATGAAVQAGIKSMGEAVAAVRRLLPADAGWPGARYERRGSAWKPPGAGIAST